MEFATFLVYFQNWSKGRMVAVENGKCEWGLMLQPINIQHILYILVFHHLLSRGSGEKVTSNMKSALRRMKNISSVVMVISVFWLVIGKSLAANIQGEALNKRLTLGYILPWTQGWPLGPSIGSAIILGMEEVRNREILPGYDIEWELRDDFCEPRRGMQVIVDLWDSVEDLDGLIGSGCSTVCQPESLLAASWGIPVVSWACSSHTLSDKDIYPTFTRVDGPWTARSHVYDHLADVFNWKKIGDET